jgi:3-deoxy-manno-octulosonate cytidylyltransferase (CMP-KDO synthetase)
MSFTVVIPARFASTRLPGKPLLDIAGMPMIQHVWLRAQESDAGRIVIATDDERIKVCCEAFGAEVCMTRGDHESGTDRLQEVAQKLALADAHIVVNVQGDEPLIPAVAINQVAANLAATAEAGIATLAEKIADIDVVFDPNAVKVVRGTNGLALYFSRAPIPWARDEFAGAGKALPDKANYLRHIGIYAYRAGFLQQFVGWPMGVLESCEKLEQLRALENGVGIHVAEAAVLIPGGVDTEADLLALRELLEQGEG